jgi:hypothetical protein
MSVSTAVRKYNPAEALVHVNWYGLVLLLPSSVPPAKNPTLATPADAVAFAARATVAGAATMAPETGLVSLTVDVDAVTVTVTGADVVVPPTLSIATAVRE